LLDIVSICAPFVNYPFPFVGISNEAVIPKVGATAYLGLMESCKRVFEDGDWVNGGITMPFISVSVNFLLLALLSLTACYCSLYSCHGDGSLVNVPTQMRKPGFLVVLDRARYSRETRKNHREV
ncbi:hypothetical protein T10_8828, partial [Trichinella papuae]